MSGYQSSKRQWMSGRVRALLTLVLALAMFLPVVSVYAAGATVQDVQQDDGAVKPYDVLCVKGSVINFDETPLPEGNDGVPWKITATPSAQGTILETTTDEDANFKFEDLTAGEWTFEIALQEGWSPITPAKFAFDVTYGKDKCAVIRFKLKRPVTVIATKIDDNHNPLSGWTIRAEPAKGNWFASPVEVKTDASGQAAFALTDGKWIFKEKAPKDTMYVPVVPDTGAQELTIDWKDNPGPINIRFKNRIFVQGCIDVFKLDVPPGDGASVGLPGWKIVVKRTNGQVVVTGYTDSQGEVKFKHLPLGPYIVTEEARIGWESVTPQSFQVNLTGADCESVTFFNQQKPPGFSIIGRKIDTNGKVGLPGWKITATPVNKGGYPNQQIDGKAKIEVFTDGQGKYTIELPPNDYRIPGSAYKVCEEDRAGWLPHTPLCQTVYLPTQPGAPAKAWDFENQQVGHWESVTYGKPSHPSSGTCSVQHTVMPGESLYGIGAAYGVSPSAMLAANPWVYNRPNYYVYPGDCVCIP